MPRGIYPRVQGKRKKKHHLTEVVEQTKRVEEIIDACSGWSEDDFLILAVAALDQGGISREGQMKIWRQVLAERFLKGRT